MLRRLIKQKNRFLDWFITEKPHLTKSQLYVQRRFVETLFLVLAASLFGYIIGLFGFKEEFPNAIAVWVCIGSLALYKLSSNNIVSGNIFISFFFFAITNEILFSSGEVVAYFKWFIPIPVFSLLFVNRNSTFFWSFIVLLTTIGLLVHDYSANTILQEYVYKTFFIADMVLFFLLLMAMVFIYYVGKEVINKELNTEQKELKNKTRDLLRVQEQLLERNKELQTYAHVVSHDLKTPLRGILGFSEILSDELTKHGKIEKDSEVHLNFIKENAAQMDELVTDILRYAELSNNASKEFKPCDLNELLIQAINSFPINYLRESITIQEVNLPKVKGLPTQIKQIFQNLISNSVKFADPNRPLRIKVFIENHEDFVQFSFEDNGIGVKEENLDYMFLPFKRLHSQSQYNGSGIGLANFSKVVKRHNGKIWAESEFGKGLKISFTLAKKPWDTNI